MIVQKHSERIDNRISALKKKKNGKYAQKYKGCDLMSNILDK